MNFCTSEGFWDPTSTPSVVTEIKYLFLELPVPEYHEKEHNESFSRHFDYNVINKNNVILLLRTETVP